MTVSSILPLSIRRHLDDFVVRSRRASWLHAIAAAIAAFLAWMLLCCGIDRLFQLPAGVRLAALAIGVVGGFAVLLRPLRQYRQGSDRARAAAAIELQNPRFGQRLITVTSRLEGAWEYRGSDEMLRRLVREVEGELASGPASGRVRPRATTGLWLICAILALLVAALLKPPQLRFKDLALRFFDPLADIAPVTTTRLTVWPGDRDLIQSQPLTIRAQAAELGDSPLMLYLSGGDGNWSRVAMTPDSAGHFTFTLPSLDRDLRYYLTGGDARTRTYGVRVLRSPGVVQFRIQYEYPPYTHLPPATVTNADGRIEAPAGTRVRLTITASEPLQAALLTVANERILMDATTDPCSRQANLLVQQPAPYRIDLISARNVAGSGPSGAAIRAVPDSPPRIHLAREGDTVCLESHDLLPLTFEAQDDYGLDSVTLLTRVNSQRPLDQSVRITRNARRQQQTLRLDLDEMGLAFGDVLTVRMIASDAAGHQAQTRPLRVLVARHSVDLEQYQRLSNLQDAQRLSQLLVSELQDALGAQEELAGQKDGQTRNAATNARADTALSSAGQTATLLRQALQRGVLYSASPRLATALTSLVDEAQIEAAASDQVFRQSGATAGMDDSDRQRLGRAVERGRKLRAALVSIAEGEQAAAASADRDALLEFQKVPDLPDADRRRLERTLSRLRQGFQAELSQLGLSETSKDLGEQLQLKVAAEQTLLGQTKPVDFVAAASRWAARILQDPQQPLALDRRLAASAQSEAIRPDADLPRANDLELAARAASALIRWARTGDHRLNRDLLDRYTADMRTLFAQPAVPREAEPARREMARWAGLEQAGSASRAAASTIALEQWPKQAEDLAMQANAFAAGHDYRQAAALDDRLVRRLESHPAREPSRGASSAPASSEIQARARAERLESFRQALARELHNAEAIDSLIRRQQQIAQNMTSANPQELIAAQNEVLASLKALQVEGSGAVAVRQGEGLTRSRQSQTAVDHNNQFDATLRRDPLLAAQRSAQAAAEALTIKPPDLHRASEHQAQVLTALSRAWEESIRRSARQRLAELPSLAAVLALNFPPANSSDVPTDRFPAAREWGRLWPQLDSSVGAGFHESDPPGYEESLKLYFEALNSPREKR